MNQNIHPFSLRALHLLGVACTLIAALVLPPALAAPGAHGPNGEHLDAPAGSQKPGAAPSVPRMETFSETFELIAQLHDGELSVLVDRYETNEPVLGATIEVESNGVQATGTFHADHGDYGFTDERLLKALSAPGEHPLMFTIIADEDSDLLEGTLSVAGVHAADDHGHDHDHPDVPAWLWIGAIVLTPISMAAAIWLSRRPEAPKTGRGTGNTGS